MSDEIKWRAGEVVWRWSGSGAVCPQGHFKAKPVHVHPAILFASTCHQCKELASLREDKALLDWYDACRNPVATVRRMYVEHGLLGRKALAAARKETEDE